MFKKIKNILLLMLPLFMATSSNLISMEESRKAELMAKLASDPIYTLYLYTHGEKPPSIGVSYIPGPPGPGGSHGSGSLPKPKPRIKEDPRFRSLEQDKPVLKGYSRDQVGSYLKSQWEQIHAYENQVGAIRESGIKYQNFDEFALDHFSLYQCENFLDYFKTLPSYGRAIGRFKERYDSDPGFRDDLDRFDNIGGFKNKRKHGWAFGFIGSHDDQRAFKDFIFSEHGKRLRIDEEEKLQQEYNERLRREKEQKEYEEKLEREKKRKRGLEEERLRREKLKEERKRREYEEKLQKEKELLKKREEEKLKPDELKKDDTTLPDEVVEGEDPIPPLDDDSDGEDISSTGYRNFSDQDLFKIIENILSTDPYERRFEEQNFLDDHPEIADQIIRARNNKMERERNRFEKNRNRIERERSDRFHFEQQRRRMIENDLRVALQKDCWSRSADDIRLLNEFPDLARSVEEDLEKESRLRNYQRHLEAERRHLEAEQTHKEELRMISHSKPFQKEKIKQHEHVIEKQKAELESLRIAKQKIDLQKAKLHRLLEERKRRQPPIFMDGNVPGPPLQPGPTTTTAVTTEQNLDSMMEAEGVTFTEDQHSDLPTINEDIGEEGPVVTLRDGRQVDLKKLQDGLQKLINKNKNKYIPDLLRVAGDNPEIRSTCEVVNRLDELAEIFSENFDPEVARMLTALSRYTIRAEQAIVKGLASGIRNFNPVASIANSLVGVAKLGTFLIGEIAKVEGLERSVLTGDIDQAAEQFHQESMAQREAASQLMQRLKSVTWEEALEHSSEIATDMLLFYGSTKFVGLASQKFLSEFTKLTEAIKVEKAVSVAAGKTTTISEGINIDIALSSKLAVEYNPEVAQNVLGALVKDAEFIASDKLGTTFREKAVNFFKRFKEKRSIRQTGARTSLEMMQEEEQLAAKMYDEIRRDATDIKTIAESLGVPEHQVARVKHHVFFDDTHILETEGRIGRFSPDLEMAQVWKRYVEKTFSANDTIMFHHELCESKIEKLFQVPYAKAHNITVKSKDKGYMDRNWKPKG